jgi:hypothetical protein
MKMPEPLILDEDTFHLVCRDEAGGITPLGDDLPAYVDVRLDTVPPTEDDTDFSENPTALRKAAAWLVAAADWLERKQGR